MTTSMHFSIRPWVIAIAIGGFLAMPLAVLCGEGPHTGARILSPSGTSRPLSLHPPEGARVAILVPKEGAAFPTDSVPLEFTLTKGKRGEHAHAYVDGELMGMFKSDRGTLTGIKPGVHVLELRVAAEDHRTELDATDRVEFVVR